MRVPSRGAPLAEVHHAAVIVRGIPRLNDGLSRPLYWPRPALNRLRSAVHWDIRYVFERDYVHDDSLLVLTGCSPGSFSPNEIITTRVTQLACACHAGAVHQAADNQLDWPIAAAAIGRRD